jgi:hypothetical protein
MNTRRQSVLTIYDVKDTLAPTTKKKHSRSLGHSDKVSNNAVQVEQEIDESKFLERHYQRNW